MKTKFVYGILLLGLVLLNSCISSKKVVYVGDMIPKVDYVAAEIPEVRIQKFDRLQIRVSSKTPELTIPFNSGVDGYIVGEGGQINTSSPSNVNPATVGYLVNSQGQITYPILGVIAAEGKTIPELQNIIQSKLIDGKLINDATVQVDLLNLKINVIGEVNNIGIQNVPDSRITILEAISNAGGLTRNGAPDRITVIREENGVRRQYVTNIESKDIFDSPVFYLKQNDLVYVEPITAVTTPKEERNWRYLTTIMGSATLIISIISLIK